MRYSTRILRSGWDGKQCYVHARAASDGADRVLLTTQKMDVSGDDCFFPLESALSTDGGKTFSPLLENESFASVYTDTLREVCCDMTPLFHRKSGRFMATGHTALYKIGDLIPAEKELYRRSMPYAVYDAAASRFGRVRYLQLPDRDKFCDFGSGCSQCAEEADGTLLIPISFREHADGRVADAKAAVMRCAFDGEELRLLELGNELEVPNEVRGIGECSVIQSGGRWYLTVRGDTYGYFCVSDDGVCFTQPEIWRWSNGEIVPTYNTQSHWFTLGNELWLVYTRKDGKNDHVFRNRAPLYAARVDVNTMTLLPETEFAAVPERGARLGNFGVCQLGPDAALITASEWMQPAGCEKYGSDNALWMTEIRK